MRFPRFQSAFELDAMFRQLPRLASVAPVTMSSFKTHTVRLADLPPAERAKINAVADRILNGFRTGNFLVVGVLFVGHADQDLAKGPAFERKISLERARQMREALLQAIQARAGSRFLALQVQEVAMRTVGLGATQRLHRHPINETQRAANRRVAIFIAEAARPIEPLLGDTFPVPRQRTRDGGPAPNPAPGTLGPSIAFSISGSLLGVPLFSSPALAGAAIFVEGPPKRPGIRHDHGFLDDGNGNIDSSKRQVPTDQDVVRKELWMKVILGGAILTKPELKDATDAYKHFLVDNNGASFTIRYDGFLREDDNGKTVLKSAIDDTRTGVLDLFDKKFPKPATAPGQETIRVTSSPVTVGRATPDFRYPYPASENWQKAIGGHALWLSATATIDSNPAAQKRAVSIVLTLHAEDMYNFNPHGTDIATNTRDAENGRFEITGLGTEFLQTGTATRTITMTVPLAKQSDNRAVPADQKVT